MKWINIFGLIIVILMLLPNMIYFYNNKSFENKCKSKPVILLEQIGRYGSMFFMVFPAGFYELGFRSKISFVLWIIGSAILLLFYWIFWAVYFKSNTVFISMMLAIIPSVLFIASGFLLSHWLLMVFGVIFGISHCYITYQNSLNK